MVWCLGYRVKLQHTRETERERETKREREREREMEREEGRERVREKVRDSEGEKTRQALDKAVALMAADGKVF